MAEYTNKLEIPKPSGSETVTREKHNQRLDIIDQNAALDPFILKSATYENNQIDVVIGKGQASFLGTLVSKTADTTYTINDDLAINTNYYILLNREGAFTHNTTGEPSTGAVFLHKVSTGSTLDTITTQDLRGQLPGAAAKQVSDNLDKHLSDEAPHHQGDIANLTTDDKTSLVAAINELQGHHTGQNIKTTTLTHGIQKITTDQATPLTLKFTGRTLVNLLGRAGKCTSLTSFTSSGVNLELATQNQKYGETCLKATVQEDSEEVYIRSTKIPIDHTQLYIGLLWCKNTATGGDAHARFVKSDGTDLGTPINTIPTGEEGVAIVKAAPADFNADTEIFMDFVTNNAALASVIYLDGLRIYQITPEEYAALESLTVEQITTRYAYVDDVKHLQNPALKKWGQNLIPPFNAWEVSDSDIDLVEPNVVAVASTKEATTYLHYHVPLIKGHTYTAGCELEGTYAAWAVAAYDHAGTEIQNYGSRTSAHPLTFTASTDADYLRFTIYTTGTGGNAKWWNPQLNMGDTALPLETYNEDYLYLQTPLAEDETLEYINGDWVRTKKWETVVVDGSWDWTFGQNNTGNKIVRVDGLVPENHIAHCLAVKAVKDSGEILKSSDPYESKEEDNVYIDDAGHLIISISNNDSGWVNDTPTADQIKKYFNQHPYTMHYKYAESVTEVIPYEGSLSLHEGDNQLEVFEGVVVRETVTPFASIDFVYINNTAASGCLLNHQAKDIIAIYKNGAIDTHNWVIRYHSGGGYGEVDISTTDLTNFDAQAVYSVTYLPLPHEFTTPCMDVSWQYNTNLKTVVDKLVEDVTDVTSDVSVIQNSVTAHLAETAQDNDVHGLKTLFQNFNPTNFIRNGDFSSWSAGNSAAPDGWENINELSISKIEGELGNACKIIDSNDEGFAYLRQAIFDTIPEYYCGKKITCVVRARNVSGGKLTLRVVTKGDDTNYYFDVGDTIDTYILTHTIDDSATSLSIQLHPNDHQASSIGTIELHSVAVVLGELPVAFANNPRDVGVWETGSNENGEYIRFADGTQICWYNKIDIEIDIDSDITLTETTVQNLTLYYVRGSWTFPAEFLSIPAVTGSIDVNSSLALESLSIFSHSEYGINWDLQSLDKNFDKYDLSLMAIGRWK